VRLLFVGRTDHVHFRRWVESFPKLGHKVWAVDIENDRPTPIPGVRVRGLLTRRKRPQLHRLELRWLARIIRPDVVHAHWASYGHLPLVAGLKPLVVTAWGSDVFLPETFSPETNARIDAALSGADLVTCDSQDMRTVILRRNGGKAPVEVVQWGVDTRIFRPGIDVADLRRELDLGSGPVVFNPRQLDAVYNPETALQAIPGVLAAIPDARFIFKHYIQEPERVAEIRQLATDLGIAAQVRFLDSVPYEMMAKLYALADVMVSVPSSDGTPMSLLEAMASGAVPLVSDLPSLREWIEDGVNGRMVPARNAPALTQALIDLLRDHDGRARMRAFNLELVKARADQENEMRRMAGLYAALSR
jgi:glycosyltransferase involved in cell wall biosynthesis